MGATAKNFPVFKKTFNKIGDFFIKSGKLSHGVGNAAGYGVMGTGFGLGVYEDINYNDKTIGEAVSHNATSLGVGVLGQTGGTAASIALTTNPGGWAILGGVAIGTLVTYGFNTAYKHNVFGIQDELDYIGQKLDQAGREVKELTTNFVENAGEAIKSSWDAINPINWGWGD